MPSVDKTDYPVGRVVITGATGTLGYNVVQRLAASHPQVQLCVWMRKVQNELFAELPNVIVEELDLANSAQILKSISAFGPDAVIHCAAAGVRPGQIDYFELANSNTSATLKLFQATCAVGNCHFIYISTGLVYAPQLRPYREDDPVNAQDPYGATKAAAELLLQAGAKYLGRTLSILRPFSFTGIHDGGTRIFPALLRCALGRVPFRMSPGTQLRDFCAVQDIVDAIALVLSRQRSSGTEIINVGSGASIPLRDIVGSVVRELGLDVELQFGALPFRSSEPKCLVADISHAASLGWRPRINLAYAVWQLARSSFPELTVTEPQKYL